MIAIGKLASMKLLITAKRTSLRKVYHNNNRLMSTISYPAHIVVNMPSLSPTMEVGTIGKWLCQVGDEIKAGSAMAEIETDKASMTFEAQDEFYIAKLLCDEGQEVKVGQPILITVDDKSLVSSFSSFTLSNTTSSSSSVTPKKLETVTPSTTQPPSLIPQSIQSIPITTTTVPVALTKAIESELVSVPTKLPTPTTSLSSSSVPPTLIKEVKKAATTDSSSSSKASKPSPLLAKFRKDQLSYIEKYGRSCHRVIQ